MEIVPVLQEGADGSVARHTWCSLDLTSLGNLKAEPKKIVLLWDLWAPLKERIWTASSLFLLVLDWLDQKWLIRKSSVLCIWSQSVQSSFTNTMGRRRGNSLHGRPSSGLFLDLSGQGNVWLYGLQSLPDFCREEAISSCLSQYVLFKSP